RAAPGVRHHESAPRFAGATPARFPALQAGEIEATVLIPPFNFYAESGGFSTVGLAVDYTPELPFSAAVVNTKWAASNRATLAKLIDVHNRSMAWFLDEKNRSEAIAVMVEAGKQSADDIAKAYHFLHQHKFFDGTGKVSRKKMDASVAALRELGDVSAGLPVEKLLLPGVPVSD